MDSLIAEFNNKHKRHKTINSPNLKKAKTIKPRNLTDEEIEKIKTELSEYKLIDLNDEIYLAHVTQLFPILENKIREYGSYLSIVPFKEKLDEYIHQKDPSSILQDIILEIYKETSSLEIFINIKHNTFIIKK